jgi:predicted amidohydrolase YtcJ
MSLSILVVVATAVAVAVVVIRARSRREARTLYLGGPILTMDAENSVAEALAVVGDRIAAVGTREELRGWAEGRTRIVDLEGRALLPGLIDGHSHFPGVGIFALHLDLNSPPIGTVEQIADIVVRLQRKASSTKRGEWVVGMGYDDTLLEERRHPTRADLDQASTHHPVAVIHISGHLAAVNSIALEKLGLRADTPDPQGGRIRRDPRTGEPDGVLEEVAMEAVTSQVLRPSLLDGIRIIREATRCYTRVGVTTAQNGFAPRRQIRALTWLSRLGIIPIRLVLWPTQEVLDQLLEGTFSFSSYSPEWVRLGAAKLIADGSIQGYTGYLSRPYHVPPADDPDYRGYPRMSREELLERVTRYHANGMQIAVHGNGDAAIDDILDAFEQAQEAHPRDDARPVIVHAQMSREDQLDRMKALGVIPSFFTLHTYYWGDRHRDLFMGPERAARMSPARSAIEHGLRFTIHCDTPVVPMEPLRLVWAAVNRRSASGASIGPEERITPTEALRAVTIEAAFQHFEEHLKGSLEPGKLADLVVLSRSPLDDPERIDTIEVLETIVGGRTVYRADALATR